jgi:hypothetical protein
MSDQARMQASTKWLQDRQAAKWLQDRQARSVVGAPPQIDTPGYQLDTPPHRTELAPGDLGLAAKAIYCDINACQSPDHLEATTKLIWERYGFGLLSDDEASYLTSCIERRKPVSWRTKAGKFAVLGRRLSRFIPRQRPRSPDRKAARDRRRVLGGSSALPDNLRAPYTEGQRAVLCIVAGEIKRHGVCDLPIDKIAALAGVCRTTVQTTMHEARRLGHIEITERPVHGRKSLPNLVQVVSREWLAWIKRGPSAARGIGSNLVKMVSTTKSIDLSKKRLSNGNAPVDPPPWTGSARRRSD